MNMKTTDKVQVGDSTTGTSTSTTASQWHTYNHYTAERGWECPRCGRINAPWVRQCDCSRSYEKQDITWNNHDYTKPWWYDYKITCNGAPIDSDTFKVHPETTTGKTTSSVCSSDSTTSVKSNPNSTIYTTATNPTVGGSDYWNPITKEWKNVDVNILNTQNNKTNLTTAWSCTIPNEFTTYRTDLPETYTTTNNDLEPLTRHFKD